MHDVDVAVIGAGVVGLACAAEFAARGRRVVVLERNAQPGAETSSRNSGVIHAGLYYPPDSWKARLCVRGRRALYARAARERLPHRRTGKLIVACSTAELPGLEALHRQGLDNDAGALQLLDAAHVTRLEPRVAAVAGLLVHETGIIDAHALVRSYLAQARAHAADLALRTHVIGIEREGPGFVVHASGQSGETFALRAARVVNAGGLAATRLAALAGLPVERLSYLQRFCKGDYFALAPRLRGLAQRLVYPLPGRSGLGVHLTLDLGGALRAGPDTEYVEEPRYEIDPRKRARFAAALRRYVPEVRDEDLTPDYSGVRPKLAGPTEGFRDFVIEDAAPHGLPGLVNLLGIESPGLTASAAIAERVAELLA